MLLKELDIKEVDADSIEWISDESLRNFFIQESEMEEKDRLSNAFNTGLY